MSFSCGDVRARVPEYLDGVLASVETRNFREHLFSCGECRDEVASIEPSLLFARVSHEEVSAKDVERVLAGVRAGVALEQAERKLALGRSKRRRRVAAIASAAALAALTLVLPGSARRSDSRRPIRAAARSAAAPAPGLAPAARIVPTGTFPADATVYDWNPGAGSQEPRVVWIVDRSLDI